MNTRVALPLMSTMLVVILLVCPPLVIKPRQQELVQLQKDVETLSGQIRRSTLRLMDIRRRSAPVQAELSKVREQLNRDLDLLPTLDDLPEVVKSIIDRGAGLALEFVSIVPVNDKIFDDPLVVSAVNGRLLYELPVQIQVRGHYRRLAQYLETLRELPYYSRIEEVDLKLKERPENPDLLEMTAHLNILYM